MSRIGYWVLFAVTMALYGIIIGWSLPSISAAAGGLAPFDLRPGGYTLTEATAFIGALPPDGAAFYNGTQHLLDTPFPALMSLTLFFAVAWLSKSTGRWRWLLATPALLIAPFDWAENYLVTQMLNAGPDGLTQPLVDGASLFTRLKSSLTTVVMVVLLVLLAWSAIRSWRRRRAVS